MITYPHVRRPAVDDTVAVALLLKCLFDYAAATAPALPEGDGGVQAAAGDTIVVREGSLAAMRRAVRFLQAAAPSFSADHARLHELVMRAFQCGRSVVEHEGVVVDLKAWRQDEGGSVLAVTVKAAARERH